MIKISRDYLGAIDGAKPYLAKYDGKNKISDIIKGNVSNCWWKTISIDEAEDCPVTIIMFVKYVDWNRNVPNQLSIAYNTQKLKSEKPIINSSIHGLVINNILFVKDKYKSEMDIDLEFCTNDLINIDRLSQSLKDCELRGRFDISTCSYYCDLAE